MVLMSEKLESGLRGINVRNPDEKMGWLKSIACSRAEVIEMFAMVASDVPDVTAFNISEKRSCLTIRISESRFCAIYANSSMENPVFLSSITIEKG